MSTPPATFESLDQRLGITAVWRRGHRGSGVTVAIADTGITPDSDLAGVVISERDFTGEGDPGDRPGERRHGTAVARLIQQIMRSPTEPASIRDAAAKVHTAIAGMRNGG